MNSASADVINPFFAGARSTLKMVLGESPKRGTIVANASETTNNQVNVVIGITGDAQGNVVIGMSLTTADKIASTMIGAPVVTFDALAASAIIELANMICGSALTALADSGCACDMTPPTIVKGVNVSTFCSGCPAIVIPMSLEHGDIFLSIALRSRLRAASEAA